MTDRLELQWVVLVLLAEVADEHDREPFSGLEADERATLRRLLSKLVDRHHIGAVPTE